MMKIDCTRQVWPGQTDGQTDRQTKIDLAFNIDKPKDWYFVLDWVQFRKELGCVILIINLSSI